MIEFNFKSQIATTIEQSERLLALGLKKETADMMWFDHAMTEEYEDWKVTPVEEWDDWNEYDIPAWSLHRLIEITSDFCDVDGEEGVWCCECRDLLGYRSVMTENWLIMWNKPSLYDNIIDCIEWLIKEGYFSKEYLV